MYKEFETERWRKDKLLPSLESKAGFPLDVSTDRKEPADSRLVKIFLSIKLYFKRFFAMLTFDRKILKLDLSVDVFSAVKM